MIDNLASLVNLKRSQTGLIQETRQGGLTHSWQSNWDEDEFTNLRHFFWGQALKEAVEKLLF